MKLKRNILRRFRAGHTVQNREIRRPVCPLQHNHVVWVDRAYPFDQAPVKRQKRIVILAKKVRKRFVEQVVCRNNRLIRISFCKQFPSCTKPLLIHWVGKKLRLIFLAIVYVLSGLPARRRVHIEYHKDAELPAPIDQMINVLQRFYDKRGTPILKSKQSSCIDWKANGVEPLSRDPFDVRMGDVVFFIPFPIRSGIFRAAERFNQALDAAGSVVFALHLPHIAFRQQPAAEAKSAQQNRRFPVKHLSRTAL
ncbi:hypothetical protein SDC9_107672 [bioreactor metagenome]|uniref:Uncharacterized protein n=1 Tax=bioreactor metagenome TaxID=1076179 RepID=A0A645B6Z1_9ZZZZ